MVAVTLLKHKKKRLRNVYAYKHICVYVINTFEVNISCQQTKKPSYVYILIIYRKVYNQSGVLNQYISIFNYTKVGILSNMSQKFVQSVMVNHDISKLEHFENRRHCTKLSNLSFYYTYACDLVTVNMFLYIACACFSGSHSNQIVTKTSSNLNLIQLISQDPFLNKERIRKINIHFIISLVFFCTKCFAEPCLF